VKALNLLNFQVSFYFFLDRVKRHSSFFGVFVLRGCAISRTGRLTDRNIKIVGQIAEVWEENCMMFRDLKEKTSKSQYFLKEKKDIRKY
jgi:hypothetical protein